MSHLRLVRSTSSSPSHSRGKGFESEIEGKEHEPVHRIYGWNVPSEADTDAWVTRLLEAGKCVLPLSRLQRERVLERARPTLALDETTTPALASRRGRGYLQFGVLVALAFVTGAGGAVLHDYCVCLAAAKAAGARSSSATPESEATPAQRVRPRHPTGPTRNTAIVWPAQGSSRRLAARRRSSASSALPSVAGPRPSFGSHRPQRASR
jgi:hypothetical protein